MTWYLYLVLHKTLHPVKLLEVEMLQGAGTGGKEVNLEELKCSLAKETINLSKKVQSGSLPVICDRGSMSRI